MTEASLKTEWVKTLRQELRGYVILRHEDRFIHGHPDASITGNKLTSWWEGKFANPGFSYRGIQELTMLRLALAGLAFYIVWWYNKGEKFTYIVHPNDIGKPRETWTRFVKGFDHQWVLEEVRKVHSDNHGP